jgi:hypothetical protein
MATRSRTSFQKRQKEIARMEKQRDKAARRAMRKLGGGENAEPDPDALLDGSVDPEGAADGADPADAADSADAAAESAAGGHSESGSRVN